MKVYLNDGAGALPRDARTGSRPIASTASRSRWATPTATATSISPAPAATTTTTHAERHAHLLQQRRHARRRRPPGSRPSSATRWTSAGATSTTTATWISLFCGASTPMRLYRNGQTRAAASRRPPPGRAPICRSTATRPRSATGTATGFPELAVADNNQLGGQGPSRSTRNTRGTLSDQPALDLGQRRLRLARLLDRSRSRRRPRSRRRALVGRLRASTSNTGRGLTTTRSGSAPPAASSRTCSGPTSTTTTCATPAARSRAATARAPSSRSARRRSTRSTGSG